MVIKPMKCTFCGNEEDGTFSKKGKSENDKQRMICNKCKHSFTVECCDKEMTTISISKEQKNQLERMKNNKRETMSDVLQRLIDGGK